jgi:lysophospholipase
MSQFVICSENNLASKYATVIQPFWKNDVQHGIFDGVVEAKNAEKANKIDIAYAFVLHPQAHGTVVISSGRIESLIKYKEVVFDLYQNGFSVFIHDHRGQGLSGRMLNNTQIGHVDNFSDYVADIKKFMDEVVTKKTQHKPSLLCHSMGGAIGVLTVLRYPELFEKVAFSAPMFGVRPPLPNWFAKLLFKLHGSLNKQAAYFFGQKDYESQPFDNNELTHSKVRYQIFRQEYLATPQVQLGGVSGKWLKMAAYAMDEIEQNVHRFPIPALVIQAGSDQIIDNKRQSRVVAKMTHSELMVIDGAKHELLEEQDKFRVPSLTAIMNFFKE